jgi:hypothetical protein
MKEKLRVMYLNWANNFLNVPKFADHYGISEEKAQRVINLGRLLHEQTISNRDFNKYFNAYMKQQIKNDFERSLGLSF